KKAARAPDHDQPRAGCAGQGAEEDAERFHVLLLPAGRRAERVDDRIEGNQVFRRQAEDVFFHDLEAGIGDFRPVADNRRHPVSPVGRFLRNAGAGLAAGADDGDFFRIRLHSRIASPVCRTDSGRPCSPAAAFRRLSMPGVSRYTGGWWTVRQWIGTSRRALSTFAAAAACSGVMLIGWPLGARPGNSTTAPFTGSRAASNGPYSAAIFHQYPCHSVSPQWMTVRLPSVTIQDSCGSPTPSTAHVAVAFSVPIRISSPFSAPRMSESGVPPADRAPPAGM